MNRPNNNIIKTHFIIVTLLKYSQTFVGKLPALVSLAAFWIPLLWLRAHLEMQTSDWQVRLSALPSEKDTSKIF